MSARVLAGGIQAALIAGIAIHANEWSVYLLSAVGLVITWDTWRKR